MQESEFHEYEIDSSNESNQGVRAPDKFQEVLVDKFLTDMESIGQALLCNCFQCKSDASSKADFWQVPVPDNQDAVHELLYKAHFAKTMFSTERQLP